MNNDMSDMMKNLTNMLNGKDVPDNIKNMISNLSANANNSSDNSEINRDSNFNGSNSNNSNCNNSDNNNFNGNNFNNPNRNNSDNSSFPEFDINTILKMKKIMDSMNNSKNDPRANLLNSLKPYLKHSRQEKVDQYVKLFNMSKAFEIINPLGGDTKNDT